MQEAVKTDGTRFRAMVLLHSRHVSAQRADAYGQPDNVIVSPGSMRYHLRYFRGNSMLLSESDVSSSGDASFGRGTIYG
jgi:hypothetical protein